MRPKRLKLTDWCQHESFEMTFVDGMNALQGANGSGKTNLLEALNLCLSQDTNGSGKKTDNIRNGANKARLSLLFEHEGVEGEINVVLNRNYTTSSDELAADILTAKQAVESNAEDSYNPVTPEQHALATFKPRETTKITLKWGDIECRNATEVAEFMRSRVLLDPKLIKNNFFPRQGDVDGAMSSDKDVRTKVFHEKAGTALCEKIWEEMGKELRALPDVGAAERELDDIKGKLALARGELKETTEAFEQAKTLDVEVETYKDITRRYMSMKQAETNLTTQQAELNRLAVGMTESEKTCNSITKEGKELRETYDLIQPNIDQWKRELWGAEQASQQHAERAQLIAHAQSLKEQLESLEEPAPIDTTQQDVEEVTKRATEMAVRAKQLKEWLDVFSEGKCPTCGQPVDTQTVASYEFELMNLKPDEAQAKARSLSEALKQYEASCAAYKTRVAQIEAAFDQVAKQLEGMPEVEVPTQDHITMLRLSLGDIASMEAKLENLRKQHAEAYGKWTTAKNSHDTLQATVQGLLKQASEGECPSEAEFKEAGVKIQEAQFNLQKQRETQVAYEVCAKRVQDLEESVKAVEAKVAEFEATKHWQTLLLQARQLMHRDALPSEVVAWYSQQLAEHTQKYLDMFDAGFQLAVSKDLDLVGLFPDKIMPASRFSGGEKNITNISMRLAMVDLFPSDMRLLVLDEVEVHLDQNKVSKLPAILEKVKGLARNRGLVVLFVSHHPMLGDVSDHVIRTSAA